MNENETTRMTRTVAALRAMADALEAADTDGTVYADVYASVYLSDMDTARKFRRGIHGWKKYASDTRAYTDYMKNFGAGVELNVSVSKGDACQRVEIGTRHVEAVEAHDEPVYRWVCP